MAVESLVPTLDCLSGQLDITRPGEEGMIKAMRFSPLKPRSARKPTVIVLAHPDGAAPYVDEAGAPRALARQLVNQGFAVAVAADAGGAADPGQTSLFFTTYNRTRLQERVRDLVSICQAVKDLHSNNCRVVLCGSGAAGFWSLLAAPAADAVIADCGQADVLDDQALLAPDLFCPGLRSIDTYEGALVLAAPHPLLLHNAAPGLPVARMQSAYKTLRAGKSFRLESRRFNDGEIAAWVAALPFPAK
jgi:dienelactone hydrolase